MHTETLAVCEPSPNIFPSKFARIVDEYGTRVRHMYVLFLITRTQQNYGARTIHSRGRMALVGAVNHAVWDYLN